VSEGCRNCYAERQAARFSGEGRPFYGFAEVGVRVDAYGDESRWPRWTGNVSLIEDKVEEPLRWRKPSRVFVNSMSDLFHEDLPDEAIDRVFAVMSAARDQTFQVLTKRPQRMLRYLTTPNRDEAIWDAAPGLPDPFLQRDWRDVMRHLPLPNVWLGVSVENQKTADERIPLLVNTPAAVRFISAEPLLGPIGIAPWLIECDCNDSPALDWVIVGGESGPNSRPCDVAWIRLIVLECALSRTPVFVKQLGSRPIGKIRDVAIGQRLVMGPTADALAIGAWLQYRHRKGGDPTEWPEDLRVRQFPEVR
jgi:protein gp37